MLVPASVLLVATLLSSACGAPRRAPDSLIELERARPAPVVRRAPNSSSEPWDDSQPAHDWPDLRATVELGSDGRAAQTREVWRGHERVQLSGPGPSLWSFRRNPAAASRVSALTLDAQRAVLVAYDHSSLLAAGLPARWDTLACLGVDPARVATLEPTAEPPRDAFGLSFEHRVGAADAGGLREVWWNATLGLPLASVERLPDGRLQHQRLSALELAPGEPPTLGELHPDLAQIDLADLDEQGHR